MYYALIDMRGSCTAITALAWGSLKQIADKVISECDELMGNLDNMSMEEYEEEYYCEFDDYKKLVDCENPTAEMIRGFSFTIGDCTTYVECLVEGYPALVKAFGEYTEDKEILDMWELVPEIEETEENLSDLDWELRGLAEDVCAGGDYDYFVLKEEDEELDFEELLENHDSDRFAIETLNWEIVSFDSDFQEEVFEKYLQKHNLTRKQVIESLMNEDDDSLASDMETIGVSVADDEIEFNDICGEENMDIQDLLVSLGWECEFEGESWKFETTGVYYIE